MGISNRFLPPSYLVSAAVCLAFSAFFNVSSVADEIIMTSGKKGTGTIVSETATSVEIETTVSGRSVKRIVPKDRVYSIEQNGKRRVLNDSEAGRKAAVRRAKSLRLSNELEKRLPNGLNQPLLNTRRRST